METKWRFGFHKIESLIKLAQFKALLKEHSTLDIGFCKVLSFFTKKQLNTIQLKILA